MVITAHMRCPICGGAFAAWCSADVEQVKCPFCTAAVEIGPEAREKPSPSQPRAAGWLAGLLAGVIRRPLPAHSG